MKKYLAALSLLLLTGLAVAAFAGAADAAQNPFMDVPEGHWAYDAIGQLAAKGVLSGYPDGAYKGKSPVTRYEMASALARALADVDLEKADKADLEMMVRLSVEFEDELQAMNVKADGLSERVGVLDERLNNWRLSGSLMMDVSNLDVYGWGDSEKDVAISLTRARLYFDRWFGENGEMYFHAALDNEGNHVWQTFYAEFPIWSDATMTVGRFEWDLESPYNFSTGGVSDLSVASFLTDRTYDGLGIMQRFSLGYFQAYVQRISAADFMYYETLNDADGTYLGNLGASYDAMEAAAMLRLQFNENVGVDLGLQYFWGDDASQWSSPDGLVVWDPDQIAWTEQGEGQYRFRFNSIYTFFGGLRFDFNENIGFRGIYYYQDGLDDDFSDDAGQTWQPADYDSSSAYRLALDIKQDLLGFTSLWLGYDFMEAYFETFSGDGGFTIEPRDLGYDMRTWRLGATQQWNEKWRTWLYIAHHTLVDAASDGGDVDGTQFGAGVEYRHNQFVAFALNYINSDFDDDEYSPRNDHILRFRTQVDF